MKITLPKLNAAMMGVVVLWGFNFVAVKLLFEKDLVSPATAALARWILMSVALVVFCRWRGLELKYPKGEAWRMHLQGFISMGIYMVFFTAGMHHIDPGVGAIILGTSPVFTLFMAVLFRQEKFQWPILLGTLLAFGGVALVVLLSPDATPGSPSFIGSILILISAVLWALGTVISKPLLKKTDPFVMTTLTMPAGLVALIPFGARDFMATDWAHLPPMHWAMLFYFAIGAGMLGFMGFYVGVKQVGAAGAMLYQYLVSPLAVLSGWMVFGRALSPGQFVGFGIVIAGVMLANRARNQASASMAAEAA